MKSIHCIVLHIGVALQTQLSKDFQFMYLGYRNVPQHNTHVSIQLSTGIHVRCIFHYSLKL